MSRIIRAMIQLICAEWQAGRWPPCVHEDMAAPTSRPSQGKPCRVGRTTSVEVTWDVDSNPFGSTAEGARAWPSD
jgi:hypothetical protein